MNSETLKRLGYIDGHVFETEDPDSGGSEVPDSCHVMAKWSNGHVTVHFDVPNSVFCFFDAFDEAGDPAAVRQIRCCDACEEDIYLDTQDGEWIDWPKKASGQ